ncbi:MAG: hypothetical protein LWX56_02125 [Ignavibacteria bacterium]|nr:hypothetical protein [Ignavibacteria bacterium]
MADNLKSSMQDLENRGFIPKRERQLDSCYSLRQFGEDINSPFAVVRSRAAFNSAVLPVDEVLPTLVASLVAERKLYTKIELSNALQRISEPAVPYLTAYLGTIGNNQHKKLPDAVSKKNSYPLPRDLAARILCQIGVPALPYLQKVLVSGDLYMIREAIDSIGFISFYNNDKSMFEELRKCFNVYSHDLIIRWKIYIACSSFPMSIEFLVTQVQVETIHIIQDEIRRSIRIIQRKKL